MRAFRFSAATLLLFPLISPPADTGTALDLVLVLQDSYRMSPYLESTALNGLSANDRVALVLFAGKPKLKVKFTPDTDKVLAAIPRNEPRMKFRLAGMPAPGPGKSCLWDALAYAVGLFKEKPDPSRRRAIVVLVGDEDVDSKASFETVATALRGANVALGASVVAALVPMSNASKAAGPPAGFPGLSVYQLRQGPVPERTLKQVERLCDDTGGSLSRQWDLPGLIEQLRTAKPKIG